MKISVFSPDHVTDRPLYIQSGAPIADPAAVITDTVSREALDRGNCFAEEIRDRPVGNFEKPGDKMAHVSTFLVIRDTLCMTYYANTREPSEDPKNQTARLAYASIDHPSDLTWLDLQTTGDVVDGKVIDMVYDTILMQKDEDTVYILWTARTEENYYRFYCPFTVSEKKLGDIRVNRFKVGDIVNDFSASGIRSALAANGLPVKTMYSDIGIMQKLSSRTENGEVWYYSGTYSGDFIVYHDRLYLFHAPIDREHIGILAVDTEDLTKTRVVLQAKMHESCFYPFVQYFRNGELAMSYTCARKHIRLAEFTLSRLDT